MPSAPIFSLVFVRSAALVNRFGATAPHLTSRSQQAAAILANAFLKKRQWTFSRARC